LVKKFSYYYDVNNQLITSNYVATGSSTYYTMTMTYDNIGNIKTLNRRGRVQNGKTFGFADIDNLTYVYDGNRLKKVDDTQGTYNQKYGFVDNGIDVATEYTYDANGNMTADLNRNITLTYNNSDLIKKIDFKNGTEIRYSYVGASKLKTEVYNNGKVQATTDYAGRFVYENSKLVYIVSSEGRILHNDNDVFVFEYQLKDHLGNVSCVFQETGTVTQETSYYPFGMAMEGLGYSEPLPAPFPPNKLGYNGHETQTQLSLGWIDYGFRQLDPVLGMWHSPDKLAEKYPGLSAYCYAGNDPVNCIDLMGLTKSYTVCGYGEDPLKDSQYGILSAGQIGGGSLGSSAIRLDMCMGNEGSRNGTDAQISAYCDAVSNTDAAFKGSFSQFVSLTTNPGSMSLNRSSVGSGGNGGSGRPKPGVFGQWHPKTATGAWFARRLSSIGIGQYHRSGHNGHGSLWIPGVYANQGTPSLGRYARLGSGDNNDTEAHLTEYYKEQPNGSGGTFVNGYPYLAVNWVSGGGGGGGGLSVSQECMPGDGQMIYVGTAPGMYGKPATTHPISGDILVDGIPVYTNIGQLVPCQTGISASYGTQGLPAVFIGPVPMGFNAPGTDITANVIQRYRNAGFR